MALPEVHEQGTAWDELNEEEWRQASTINGPPDPVRKFVLDERVVKRDPDAWIDLYTDLATRLLAIFRELLAPGAWLYALDEHHQSYRFFPHRAFEKSANLDEFTGRDSAAHQAMLDRGVSPPRTVPHWKVAPHADGDPEHRFVAADGSMLWEARYDGASVQTLIAGGGEFTRLLDADLPELLQLSEPGDDFDASSTDASVRS